jgi:hypothetical protein
LINIDLLYCAKFPLLSSSVISRVYDYTSDYSSSSDINGNWRSGAARAGEFHGGVGGGGARSAVDAAGDDLRLPACDQTLPFSDPDHATLRAKNADHAFTASHEGLLGLA